MITMSDFENNFESINIYGEKIRIEPTRTIVKNEFEKTTFTNIWTNMDQGMSATTKSIIGDIYMIFRNQGDDNILTIFLSGNFTLQGDKNLEYADLFCRFVKYLFKLVSDSIEKYNVVDKNGKKFIISQFHYSKNDFKNTFPEWT